MANEGMKTRTLKVQRNLDYKTRTETFEGEDYLVVPVVALVETVVFASNADAPELVPAEVFSKTVAGWNGRPVFSGHPEDGGTYVSGNTPETLEAKAIGLVFAAHIKGKKLLMEAWLNVEKTKLVEPDLLTRLENKDAIEVSVGVYVETIDETGTFEGKEYKGVWDELVQDHLAILPAGVTGACSVEAGCGIRAAKENGMSNGKSNFLTRVMQTLKSLQAPAEMSSNDVARKIGDALQKVDPRAYYPDDVYPEKGFFVYSVYTSDGIECYKRGYALAENGDVTLSGDPVKVERIVTYEEVGAAADLTVAAAAEPNKNASEGACSCHKTVVPTSLSQETKTMAKTKDELIAQITAMSDEQVAAVNLEPAAVAAEVVATPAVVPAAVVAEAPAALATKETPAVTFESLMAAAPADVREAFAASQRQLADRKATTISALKASGRCDIADEKLKAMSQGELDQLVKLAGVDAPAAVDYSGMGAARNANESEEIAAPTDLAVAVKALRANEKK